MRMTKVGFEPTTSESVPQLIYQLSHRSSPFNRNTPAIAVTKIAPHLSESKDDSSKIRQDCSIWVSISPKLNNNQALLFKSSAK